MSVATPVVEEPAHALLGPSSCYRWSVCTPSARIEAALPDSQSEAAAEGTFAHLVAEHCLLAGCDVRHFNTTEHGGAVWWNETFIDYVQGYVDRCRARMAEIREKCSDAAVHVEARLYLDTWAPESFGTGDLVIVADGIIDITDLKFGKGKEVSAIGNHQMRLYALGAYDAYGHLFAIDKIRMCIDQPRMNNYSEETLDLGELLAWGETIRGPARLAFAGEGCLVAGDHCDFCRARFTCKARAEYNLATAALDFAGAPEGVPEAGDGCPPRLLSLAEIAALLPRLDALKKWATEVQDYALKQAAAGAEIPGYKLCNGRSNRRYGDPDAVAAKLLSSGLNESQIYERSLLTITALEKVLGKKKFAELLADMIIKPPGAAVLVPVSDPRPEIKSSAATDFGAD